MDPVSERLDRPMTSRDTRRNENRCTRREFSAGDEDLRGGPR